MESEGSTSKVMVLPVKVLTKIYSRQNKDTINKQNRKNNSQYNQIRRQIMHTHTTPHKKDPNSPQKGSLIASYLQLAAISPVGPDWAFSAESHISSTQPAERVLTCIVPLSVWTVSWGVAGEWGLNMVPKCLLGLSHLCGERRSFNAGRSGSGACARTSERGCVQAL